MKLYDQHLHTFLSSDSGEKFENYLRLACDKGLTHFVSTEHLDLSCRSMGCDDMPDLLKLNKILQKLNKTYDLTVLKGIEIGYKFSRLKDIKRIVNHENFDMVIMSVHESEDSDCTKPIYSQNLTADAVYGNYLDIYIHMLQHCSCFDIVGHIDFLLRYIDPINIEAHQDKLSDLLHMVIDKGKSLEFNTRFLYAVGDDSYLKYIFTLYRDLGGRKVSLGSDAHSARYFMGSFDEAISILKNIGFEYICTYQKRQEKHVLL